MGNRRMSGASSPSASCRSAVATALLVVPRSMPMTKRECVEASGAATGSRSISLDLRAATPSDMGETTLSTRLANVPFELPPPVAAALGEPQLERPHFGDSALEANRHHRAIPAGTFERDLEWRQLFDLVAIIVHEVADGVLLAHAGAEEAELRKLPHDETELAFRNRGISAFLHPERDDAERAHGSVEAGHRRHGALDADVVGARCAAADSDPAPAARHSIVRGPERNGAIQIRRIEDRLGAEWREPVGNEPPVERGGDTSSKRLRFHHAAVEQQVRGSSQAARAAPQPHRSLRGVTGQLAKEPRQMSGDARIGGIGQAQLLQPEMPLPLRTLFCGRNREKALDDDLVEIGPCQ